MRTSKESRGSSYVAWGCAALTLALTLRIFHLSIKAYAERLPDVQLVARGHELFVRNRLRARQEFHRLSDVRSKDGVRHKAKEVFEIGELQDNIFSYLSVAEIFKLRRVCRLFTTAIDNESNTALQKRLGLFPNRASQLDKQVEPEYDIFKCPDGHSREIVFDGTHVYIKLQYWPKSDNSPYLDVEFIFKKGEASPKFFLDDYRMSRYTGSALPSTEVEPNRCGCVEDSAGHTICIEAFKNEDLRLDMMFLGTYAIDPQRFTIGMAMEDENTNEEWRFQLNMLPEGLLDQHGRIVREKGHLNGIYREDVLSYSTQEWVAPVACPGKFSSQDVPLRGTFREMLVFLETHFLRERELYIRGCETSAMDVEDNQWWDLAYFCGQGSDEWQKESRQRGVMVGTQKVIQCAVKLPVWETVSRCFSAEKNVLPFLDGERQRSYGTGLQRRFAFISSNAL